MGADIPDRTAISKMREWTKYFHLVIWTWAIVTTVIIAGLELFGSAGKTCAIFFV
jgi:hypothetical protein